MENTSKKFSTRARSIVVFVVFLALCFGIGLFIGYFIKSRSLDISWVDILLSVVFMYVSALLHIILHELGHMLVAMARGWKFLSFMMLGMLISRKGGKLSFSRYSVAGAAGQCLMTPPEGGDTDAGIAMYNAGGVIANTVVSLVALCLALFAGNALSHFFQLFLLVLAGVGVFIILLNAIPSKMSGVPNDGMNILNLRKDKFCTYIFLQSMRAMGAMQGGTRISGFQHSYLTEGREIDYSNSIHMLALSLDYARALDLMDFDKACELLDGIEANMDSIANLYRMEFSMENIYLSLVHPKPGCDVDRLMTKELKSYIRHSASVRPCGLRIRYAIALLHDRNEAEAEKLYDSFLKLCSSYFLPGEVETEKMLVEYARKMSAGDSIQ